MDGHVVGAYDGGGNREHEDAGDTDGQEDRRGGGQGQRTTPRDERDGEHAGQIDRDERREDALLGHEEAAVLGQDARTGDVGGGYPRR